jgi:putative ABC transport system permease protein
MLAITLADLRYRYRQFLIAVIGTAVVLAMALLLSGLANGFKTELRNVVGSVGADRWVLSAEAHGRITSVSAFGADVVERVGKAGATRADGIAILPQEVMRAGKQLVTVTVFGVTPGGLGMPDVHDGAPLAADGQLVVDARAHVARGTTISFGHTSFHVVGKVHGQTINAGIPVVYMSLHDAQRVLLGNRPVVTAVVTKGVPRAAPPGFDLLTNAQVEAESLTTLDSAVASIENSRNMMWIIAAIIVAALIYVAALQRVRDFAVLKALGSSSRLLFASLCTQAVIVTLCGAVLALILSQFMTGVFDQPVDVSTTSYATLPVVAVVVGLVASLVALRQATGADPAAAFAG